MALALVLAACGSASVRQSAEVGGDWTRFGYDAARHNAGPKNTGITAANVRSLTLAWAFQAHAVAIKSTPLEVDGILYFTVPDHVWAADARTGRQIWHYEFHSQGGDHIGHRGVGMYGNWLYFTTPDAHLVSLNAKDGTVRWNIELADVNAPAPRLH